MLTGSALGVRDRRERCGDDEGGGKSNEGLGEHRDVSCCGPHRYWCDCILIDRDGSENRADVLRPILAEGRKSLISRCYRGLGRTGVCTPRTHSGPGTLAML